MSSKLFSQSRWFKVRYGDKSPNIIVVDAYPQVVFDDLMCDLDYTDSTVESVVDAAFISIVTTDSCNDGYMVEKHGVGDTHWFKQNHPNVLNLEFDDISEDMVYKEKLLKTITSEQANRIVEFIDRNINKHIIVHCHAGVSRSGAVVQYIRDFYPEKLDKRGFDLKIKPRINPNQKVYSELKKAFECYHLLPSVESVWEEK